MSFVLPLSTHTGGKKTLRLRGIWRAQHWRERVHEIEDAIVNEKSLETVEVSDIVEDVDRLKVLDAVLRNPHVKILKFCDCLVDSDTLARVLKTGETLQCVTFDNVHFDNVDDVSGVIQSHNKHVKYVSFHWLDDGVLANAVARSLRYHSSWKTLRLFVPSSLESAHDTPLGHWSIYLNDVSGKRPPYHLSLNDDEGDTLHVFE